MNAKSLSDGYRRYLAAVTVYHSSVAAALGMGASDYQALNLLSLSPDGLAVGDLAVRTGLTHSAATRMVDRLVAGGYARRDTDPRDRRRQVVRSGDTSPPGLAHAVRGVRDHVAPAFAGLSDHDLTVLSTYFDSATAGFEAATAQLIAPDVV